MLINEMQTAAARTEMAAVVMRSREHNEATILTHYGKPAAVVVPHAWFERATRALLDAEVNDPNGEE